MGKKTNDIYFENFRQSSEVFCEAAEKLKQLLTDFDPDKLQQSLASMHEIEHKGDKLHHDLTEALVKAFITPIERNDIIELSQCLDNVTDTIEDILIHIYMSDIKVIRPQALEFADTVISCCKATNDLLNEFENFKKSKLLKPLIIEINRIEEEGDEMYVKFVRELYVKGGDPLLIMTWRELFSYFENCCDACEDVADIVESIVIGNI